MLTPFLTGRARDRRSLGAARGCRPVRAFLPRPARPRRDGAAARSSRRGSCRWPIPTTTCGRPSTRPLSRSRRQRRLDGRAHTVQLGDLLRARLGAIVYLTVSGSASGRTPRGISAARRHHAGHHCRVLCFLFPDLPLPNFGPVPPWSAASASCYAPLAWRLGVGAAASRPKLEPVRYGEDGTRARHLGSLPVRTASDVTRGVLACIGSAMVAAARGSFCSSSSAPSFSAGGCGRTG